MHTTGIEVEPMGDIGTPSRRYAVLPVPAISLGTAEHWTVPARATVPAPEPMPVPQPEPTPEPVPTPGDPMPTPTPDPGPTPTHRTP
jgi:hypothetical protein